MIQRLGAVLCVLLLAAPVAARQRYGIRAPERLEVAGKQLTLMGMGLRKKWFIKVYLADNYVEHPSTDPKQIIADDEVKRVHLDMLYGVGRDKINEAIREGFERNSSAQMPKLEARLKQFEAAIPEQLNKGDQLSFTYVPGQGTTITVNDKDRATIPGKDFADALWSVWLGPNPVDDGLKDEMLIGADKEQ